MTRRLFCGGAAAGVASLATSLLSCGYQVGGKADLIPKTIQTIAIPAFSTATTRYKLIDQIPQEIGREFIARTRFRIEEDPNVADAVLNGRVSAVSIGAVITDPTSGKATTIAVNVSMAINLVERATGRVLYTRPSLAFRENYEVALDAHQVFDESGPALDRLAREVARNVVSSIVENF